MGKRPLRDIQGAEGKLTAKTGVKELHRAAALESSLYTVPDAGMA